MTQYLITHERINPSWATLDAANVADGHYDSKARPELVEKAEAVERYYKAQLDEVWEEAERDCINPWDKLVSVPHARACQDLETIKQKYDGAIDCECAPDGSTTCRLCKAEAHVRHEYASLFEEDK